MRAMEMLVLFVPAFVVLAAFVVGLYVGSHLTYRRERGVSPIPFASAKAILRRFGGQKKHKDDGAEPATTERRYTA